jgi:hypothetical protein
MTMSRPEEKLRAERWRRWHLYRSSSPRRYITHDGREITISPAEDDQ